MLLITMGVLLAKFGRAKWGSQEVRYWTSSVDQHLKGFRALGRK